jgi:hypothetical protein
MKTITHHGTPAAPPLNERPTCPCCGKRLTPRMNWESKRMPGPGYEVQRVNYRWSGSYRGYGKFCTLRCCEKFANAAYQAGYRIKP